MNPKMRTKMVENNNPPYLNAIPVAKSPHPMLPLII